MPTSKLIDDVPELATHARHLTNMGYTKLSQFEDLARAAPDALAAYLNTSSQEITSLLAAVSPIVPGAAALGVPPALPLGARLDNIAPAPKAMMRPPGLAAALPESVNMIDQMQPIRDQGQVRGTCVAHAATAVAEHYFRQQLGRTIDLSRQFLYWDCKQNDGDPTHEGTWISVAMKCLTTDGCCLETTWPYNPSPIAGNESQDPPLPGAAAAAKDFIVPTYRQLPPTSIPDIKGELAAQRCVAFTIPVYQSWYGVNAVAVTRTGAITNPIPGESNIGAHAMCFVGYQDDADDVANGGGYFILRNSWNSNWATESAVGVTGYGTIPYSYINAYCVEAYSIGA
jgi:C1A family cysteine protease